MEPKSDNASNHLPASYAKKKHELDGWMGHEIIWHRPKLNNALLFMGNPQKLPYFSWLACLIPQQMGNLMILDGCMRCFFGCFFRYQILGAWEITNKNGRLKSPSQNESFPVFFVTGNLTTWPTSPKNLTFNAMIVAWLARWSSKFPSKCIKAISQRIWRCNCVIKALEMKRFCWKDQKWRHWLHAPLRFAGDFGH